MLGREETTRVCATSSDDHTAIIPTLNDDLRCRGRGGTLAVTAGVIALTLSIGQVIAWTGLKKTKVQELANKGELATSKLAGRTLWLTCSVIALIERNRVQRGR